MSGFEIGGLDAFRVPEPIRQGFEDGIGGAGEGGDAPLTGFAKELADSVRSVQSLQEDVAEKYEGLAKGEPVPLHEIYMASNKADVAFTLMLEVRNKLVDAWQQLARSAV